jgi:DNA replication protein DnaC
VLTQQTLDKLHALRLPALAEAFQQQMRKPDYADLSFEERVGLMVEAEWTRREQRKLSRRLKSAHLRHQASVEDIDFRAPRGLDRSVVLSLGSCGFIRDHLNILITGPAGVGKSYLACALGERACRSGFSVHYVRAPRLYRDLAVARGDGSWSRLLGKLAKVDLLILDDWGLAPMADLERRDLLEIVEDRCDRGSTILTSQLPVKAWHETIGEPTIADAICDRLLSRAHKLELRGQSLRPPRSQDESPR